MLGWAVVLNTPSHHRVHHGKNVRYLDKNDGGLLILWDRIFGKLEEESERVVYGLTHDIATYNPLRIAFHEYAAIGRDFARSRSLGEAMGRTFRGPAWKPSAESVPPLVERALLSRFEWDSQRKLRDRRRRGSPSPSRSRTPATRRRCLASASASTPGRTLGSPRRSGRSRARARRSCRRGAASL